MNTLQVAASSPWWIHAGAALILWAHIIGGTVGMAAGAGAMALRKGSRLHVLAGRAFGYGMLAMTIVGATVAPLLVTRQGDPKWFDSLAGAFTLYLVATGWMTMRRRPGTTGAFEIGAMIYAAALAAAAVGIGLVATQRPDGLYGGHGAGDYYGFAAIFALAVILDLNHLRHGGVTGTARLARHLWRMGLALFVALGSFFFGQQRQMPEWMQGSPWLGVPPLASLALLVFWIVQVRIAGWLGRIRRRRATASAA